MNQFTNEHMPISLVHPLNALPQAAYTRRRQLRVEQQGIRIEAGHEWDAQSNPALGWWSWNKVDFQQKPAATQLRGVVTFHIMKQSTSSWEDANEHLNGWKDAEEIKPLFRSSRNYGTFTRKIFHYSGALHVPASKITLPTDGIKSRQSDCSESSDGAQESGAFVVHTLRPGDTLSSLAITYKVHINDITRANGISGMGSHASLLVRKTLRIPVLSGSSACSEKFKEKQTLHQVHTVEKSTEELHQIKRQKRANKLKEETDTQMMTKKDEPQQPQTDR